MSPLKRNIAASYVSQIYVAAIGILLVPAYVRYMGPEAYGLIGFYSMLQAWFMLLDLGLTPTMTRETARFRGGSLDALTLRRFVRALEGVFVFVALVGAVTVMLGSNFIATKWLKVEHLPITQVRNALLLIAAIMAMRWVSSLYKGAITGFERLVWLSGFNIVIATLRFVLVIPLFIYVSANPTLYFAYQLGVSALELLILVLATYRLVPAVDLKQHIRWDWKPLAGVLRFSLAIAFTGSIWVVVTQLDKLVLSKLLPLSEYAYFTLAVLMASGVTLASGPIAAALLPRLVKLNAEGNDEEFIQLYRNATQLVAITAVPTALVLALFSRQIVLAWTGNPAIASSAAPVLTLYALGNGILALSAFPYYLQFAKGDLKLHLIGSALFVAVLIPSLVLATSHYGKVGAGYAWLCSNVMYFLFWVPAVHRRFFKGLHRKWMLQDLASILLMAGAFTMIMERFVRWPAGRGGIVGVVSFLSAATVVIAAAGSSWVRGKVVRQRA